MLADVDGFRLGEGPEVHIEARVDARAGDHCRHSIANAGAADDNAKRLAALDRDAIAVRESKRVADRDRSDNLYLRRGIAGDFRNDDASRQPVVQTHRIHVRAAPLAARRIDPNTAGRRRGPRVVVHDQIERAWVRVDANVAHETLAHPGELCERGGLAAA